MLPLLNFLKVSLCLHFALFDEAKEVEIDSDTSIQFDNFVEHKFHYLEVPNKTNTKVLEFADCAMECLTSSACFSLNMASASDEEGMFWCELLFADIFNSSYDFRENRTSNHFSKWVGTKLKDKFLS